MHVCYDGFYFSRVSVMYHALSWQPTASNIMLQRRAQLLRGIREFFWQHNVMEVDTQLLSLASISDPHIDVLTTKAKCLGKEEVYYLQTSPEFAMKRLLCSGYGDMYQLGKVFRAEEQSNRHSIEFTLLEWYRLGIDHWQLMYEIEALLVYVSQEGNLRCEFQSYVQAFQHYVGIDPFSADLSTLQNLAHQQTEFGLTETNRDTLLELLFSTLIEPNIGQTQPCFIHSYPASQAALAKTSHLADVGTVSDTNTSTEQKIAARFELYWRGVELANGYHELTDAQEQMTRMQSDMAQREEIQREKMQKRQMDERLVTALESGLPECAGVALGVDRLLMVLEGVNSINEVIPFALDRA